MAAVTTRSIGSPRLLAVAAGLLIVKVTVAVVVGYRNYFPPNFNSDFLHGRDTYFFGAYQWAFNGHILTGPFTLLFGLLLMSERFRLRFPMWHRMLGRIQVMLILLLLAPTGFWMAWYAAAGPVSAIGFALLALLTACCAAMGWRTAVRRKFVAHRQWMWRCYLLLCSAVLLRVLGGLAIVSAGYAPWMDPVASWGSWIIPLATYEVALWRTRRLRLIPRSA